MSTIVVFVGNLAEDRKSPHTRDEHPSSSCRVMVTNRTRSTEGERVDGEPIAHDGNVYGTAAMNLYDSAGRGDRVVVRGLMKTETWTDRATQQKQTKQVVEVINRFGVVGGSFKFAAKRIERQPPTTASVTLSAMPSSADEQPAAAVAAAG